MLTIAYTELNAFAFIILALISVNIYNHGEIHLFEQKIFLALLGFNALVLVLDTIHWDIDGIHGAGFRTASLIVAAVYASTNPLVCLFWSIYADYTIYKDEKRIKKLIIPLFLPVYLNLIFAVLSCKYGYIFYFDQNNVYHRGKLFFIMAVACYIYLVCTMIVAIINRKRISKKTFTLLLSFAVFPYIGGIIQVLVYGVSLVWISMTISILIIFINLQNNQMYTDHLTGLYNRKQLDNYLQECEKSRYKLLAGVMIDLDSFKKINDNWGHDTGDKALTDAANILEKSFSKDDFICRYGGDEFMVILKIKEKSDLLKAIEKLQVNTLNFSDKSVPYKISFSMGYDIYDGIENITFQQFFKHIDELMYEDKKRKRDVTDFAV